MGSYRLISEDVLNKSFDYVRTTDETDDNTVKIINAFLEVYSINITLGEKNKILALIWHSEHLEADLQKLI